MLANRFSLPRGREGMSGVAFRLIVTLLLLVALFDVGAREVAGQQLAERLRVDGVETPLLLNGAGVRRKFFFSIYIGALYLPKKTHDAALAMSMPGPKRVVMRFLYAEIPAKKLARAWREGFEDNLNEEERGKYAAAIRAFWSLFPTLRKGDEVIIDDIPGQGVMVRLNGEMLGRIEQPGFMSMLLRIWLGSSPVTSGLKQAMLGL